MIRLAKQISPLLPLESGVQAKLVLCDRYHNITSRARAEGTINGQKSRFRQ
jgi:hypothetical protein